MSYTERRAWGNPKNTLKLFNNKTNNNIPEPTKTPKKKKEKKTFNSHIKVKNIGIYKIYNCLKSKNNNICKEIL